MPIASGGLVNRLMDSPADRLKWARQNAGFESAREVADRIGVPYGTYVGHENGSRGITAKAGERYARLLRVSPAWLLYGKATDQMRLDAVRPGFSEPDPATAKGIDITVHNGTAKIVATVNRRNFEELLEKVQALRPLLK